MICAADNTFYGRLSSRQKQMPNPYNTRILSLYQAYKGTNLCEFWVQERGAGVTAFLSRYAGNITIDICSEADEEELCEFLEMTGFQSVLFDGAFDLKLKEVSACYGAVRRFAGNAALKSEHALPYNTPGFRELHNLLKTCEGTGFRPPDFESFFLDMSHMTRHGCADMLGVWDGGALAACALSVYQCENASVLGAVCCAPDKRRRGFGSRAVLALINKLQKEGKANLFLHCSSEVTMAFYERLGFKACGQWRELTR